MIYDVTVIGGGIVGLIVAMFVFGQNSKYKNRSIRYGLYFGSILLLIHTIMYNWETLENDSKFVIMIITLLALIFYVYNNFTESEENKLKPNKKKNVTFVDDNDDREAKYLPATYVNYEPSELFGAHYNGNFMSGNEYADDDEIMNY